MTYRREIDGLRAVSVLSVILFHADLHIFSGGFVGVDVFFVISGFLITTILLNEHQAGTFSLVSFYERRARRVLPALFVVGLACLPFAWRWLVPADLESFSRSLDPQVRGTHARLRYPPLPDAGPLPDPLVGGVETGG